MNRLLLDTCALIWLVEGEPLSEQALAAVDQSYVDGVPVMVSPFSAWERGMLISKGRLASPIPPLAWFDRLLERPELALAELSPAILTHASFLPGKPHNDPADRIMIATARERDLTLVTRDEAILSYAAQGHVRALPC